MFKSYSKSQKAVIFKQKLFAQQFFQSEAWLVRMTKPLWTLAKTRSAGADVTGNDKYFLRQCTVCTSDAAISHFRFRYDKIYTFLLP